MQYVLNNLKLGEMNRSTYLFKICNIHYSVVRVVICIIDYFFTKIKIIIIPGDTKRGVERETT